MKVCVPSHESQIRCIAGLPTEDQVKVAKEVYETVGEKGASADDFLAAKKKLFPPTKLDGEKLPKAKPAADEPKEAAPNTVAEPVIFDTKLVSFSELKKMANSAYMYCGTKPQEALKIIGKLQRHLDEWVDWQAKQPKAQEVA